MKSSQIGFLVCYGVLCLSSAQHITYDAAPGLIDVVYPGTIADGTSDSEPFNFSYINKDLKDLGAIGDFVATILLPQNTDAGCDNCTGSGTWVTQTGGYTSSEDEGETLLNFFESGWITLTASDVNLNLTLDFDMEPGYTPVNVFLPLYTKNLSHVQITEHVRFDFYAEFGIPFEVILNSELVFTAGMVVSIPSSATLNISFGDLSQSSQSGFDASEVSLVPFRVDHADVSASIITGCTFRIFSNLTVDVPEVNVTGGLQFDLNVPKLNATTTLEGSPVDSSCNPPSNGEQTYSPAVALDFTGDIDIGARGALTVKIGDIIKVRDSKTWPLGTIASRDFDQQCLFADRVADKFLSNTSSTNNVSVWLMLGLMVTAWVALSL